MTSVVFISVIAGSVCRPRYSSPLSSFYFHLPVHLAGLEPLTGLPCLLFWGDSALFAGLGLFLGEVSAALAGLFDLAGLSCAFAGLSTLAGLFDLAGLSWAFAGL